MTEEWGAILVVDDDAEMRELVHDVLRIVDIGFADERDAGDGVVGGDQASLSGHRSHPHDGLWVGRQRG